MPASAPSAREPFAEVLGSGPSPTAMLRSLRDQPGLVCLTGDWFGGHPLITHTPVTTRVAVADLPADWLGAPLGASHDQEVGVPRIGGGWVGVLGYQTESATGAVYDWVLRHDEANGWVFESLGLPEAATSTAAALAGVRALLAGTPLTDTPATDTPATDTPATGSGRPGPYFRTALPVVEEHQRHLAIVERAQQLIRAGDFYQVNLCTRLYADTDLSPTDAFLRCRSSLAPVHGALVNHDRGGVVSLSPELFLAVTGDRVVTKPIKGTAPRTADQTDAPALRRSIKESAENVMIVDLMRNDLSRVCRPGTVVVSGLLDLEAHPGVWHLVSTVEGRLRAGIRLAEVLAETFPPGSVTGAPKSSALRAIAELESAGRGAYTGALGMLSPLAGAEFNVVIRSFEFTRDGDRHRVELGVGGGITSDSIPELEWAECLHKARPLVAALGGTLPDETERPAPAPTSGQWTGGVFESCLVEGGRVRRLRRHLARLDRSCRELYGVALPSDLTERARDAARSAWTDSAASRIALKIVVTPVRDGVAVELTTRVLGERLPASAMAVAQRPDGLWRHKWVDRTALTRAEAAVSPDLPIFLDDQGAVLEGSRGNLFLLTGSEVRTPPLQDGLLPGVTREALIEAVPDLGLTVRLTPLTVEDLTRADAVWWTSSLSGVVAVTAVDGRPMHQLPELINRLHRNLD